LNPPSDQVPIYLINLDRRPDRLDYMAGQLARLGLAFTRFAAIDAKTTSDAEIATRIDPRAAIIRMPRGSQCGALSHIAVWEMIARGDAEGGIVFEDDMELSSDFAAICRDLSWLPSGIELVQLERKGSTRPKLMGPVCGATSDGREIRLLHSRAGGAGAYLITRKAAQRFLATMGRLRVPIDHVLFNANISRPARQSRIAAILPALARQRREDFASDITPTPVRPNLWQRLVRGWYEINRLPQQLLLMASGQAKPVKFEYGPAVSQDAARRDATQDR
jgi:glycosyl transferase family 25